MPRHRDPKLGQETCFCYKNVIGGDPHVLGSDCIVNCDQDCDALVLPLTVDELRAALIHWRQHESDGGYCAHGGIS